jgi:hypothetical protein
MPFQLKFRSYCRPSAERDPLLLGGGPYVIIRRGKMGVQDDDGLPGSGREADRTYLLR